MEGRRDLKAAGFETLFDTQGFSRLDGVDRAGQNDLTGAIIIGENDVGHFGDDGRDGFSVCLDSHHGTRCGLGGLCHQASARSRNGQRAVDIETARQMQRHDLAEAVATGHVRINAEAFKQGKLGERDSGDGRLRILHFREALCLFAKFDLIESGRREGETVKLFRAGYLVASCNIPNRTCRREGHGKVCAHADILAALAGEQERNLAGLWWHGGGMNARAEWRGAERAGLDLANQARGLGGEVFLVVSDDGDAYAAIGFETGLGGCGERRESVFVRLRVEQAFDLFDKRIRSSGREEEEFGR